MSPAYFDEGFFVRDPAWHGLGVVLPDYPDWGKLFSHDEDDPYVLAGHDFEVIESDLFVPVPDPWDFSGQRFEKLPGWKAMKNSSTGTVFQVAQDSYTAIQNTVGWELAEQVQKLDPNVKLVTGITLKGGAVCSILMKLDEPWVAPGDNSPSYPYVNINWTHDGSGALRLFETDIRTVCWNTQSWAQDKADREGRSVAVKHTKNALVRVEAAKEALTSLHDHTARFQELAQELCAIRVTDAQREAFVQEFIPKPVGEVISDRVLDNINEARAKVRALFDGPTIADEHRNTAFGLVQAGTEYLDHLRGARSSETLFGRQLLRQDTLKARLAPMVRELVRV